MIARQGFVNPRLDVKYRARPVDNPEKPPFLRSYATHAPWCRNAPLPALERDALGPCRT